MSEWTHSFCDDCWIKEPTIGEARRALPARLVDAPKEICCICGKEHQSGIYFRKDPRDCACKGKTGIHKEET